MISDKYQSNLVDHNSDLTLYQANNEWDTPELEKLRKIMRLNMRSAMILLSAGRESLAHRTHIEIFYDLENYENIWLKALGVEPLTKYPAWIRTEHLVKYMVEFFGKEDTDDCQEFVLEFYSSFGPDVIDFDDNVMHSLIAGYFTGKFIGAQL